MRREDRTSVTSCGTMEQGGEDDFVWARRSRSSIRCPNSRRRGRRYRRPMGLTGSYLLLLLLLMVLRMLRKMGLLLLLLLTWMLLNVMHGMLRVARVLMRLIHLRRVPLVVLLHLLLICVAPRRLRSPLGLLARYTCPRRWGRHDTIRAGHMRRRVPIGRRRMRGAIGMMHALLHGRRRRVHRVLHLLLLLTLLLLRLLWLLLSLCLPVYSWRRRPIRCGRLR